MKKGKLLSAILSIALFSNSFITTGILPVTAAEKSDILQPAYNDNILKDAQVTIIPNTLEQLVSKDGSFDVSKYIYGVEYPEKTSEVPPIINTESTNTTTVTTETTTSETLEVSGYITTDEPEGTTMPADKTTTTTTTTAATTADTTTTTPITLATIPDPFTTSYLIDGIAPGWGKADADDISLAPGETTVMTFSVPVKLGKYDSCNGTIYLPEGLKCVKVTYGNGKEVDKIYETSKGDEWAYRFKMPETSVTLTISADKELCAGRYFVRCDATKTYDKPFNGNQFLRCVGGNRYADREVEINVIGNNDDNIYLSDQLASIYGDVDENNDINIADLVKMNLYILNPEKSPLSIVQIANADCLRDNNINTYDSVILMNYLCEIIGMDRLGKNAKSINQQLYL